jgi:hypothetical protein
MQLENYIASHAWGLPIATQKDYALLATVPVLHDVISTYLLATQVLEVSPGHCRSVNSVFFRVAHVHPHGVCTLGTISVSLPERYSIVTLGPDTHGVITS